MKKVDPLAGSVMNIIRGLNEFSDTRDVTTLSRARRAITTLAEDKIAVAESLWDITIFLQRELLDTGSEDGEADE